VEGLIERSLILKGSSLLVFAWSLMVSVVQKVRFNRFQLDSSLKQRKHY
jgi:hypothetical protein